MDRQNLVRRGQRLEYFTFAYNSAEGLVSIIAGIVTGSVSLFRFGLDSLIEVISGAALLWRLQHDPIKPTHRPTATHAGTALEAAEQGISKDG